MSELMSGSIILKMEDFTDRSSTLIVHTVRPNNVSRIIQSFMRNLDHVLEVIIFEY